MADPWPLLLVRDLRARAEEIFTRAETFHNPEARQRLRTIAATYEKLAERLEGRARDVDNGSAA
jgi:hypothetical protein